VNTINEKTGSTSIKANPVNYPVSGRAGEAEEGIRCQEGPVEPRKAR
jgi:hypothetical protein